MKCTMCGKEINGLAYLSPDFEEKKRCRCMNCMRNDQDYIKAKDSLSDFWDNLYDEEWNNI